MTAKNLGRSSAVQREAVVSDGWPLFWRFSTTRMDVIRKPAAGTSDQWACDRSARPDAIRVIRWLAIPPNPPDFMAR